MQRKYSQLAYTFARLSNNENRNMDSPRIAAINLDHPKLQEAWMQTPAWRTLRELKKMGQARWAKYKGYPETIVSFAPPTYKIIF